MYGVTLNTFAQQIHSDRGKATEDGKRGISVARNPLFNLLNGHLLRGVGFRRNAYRFQQLLTQVEKTIRICLPWESGTL